MSLVGSKRHIWALDLFKALEKHRALIGPDYEQLVAEKHAKLAQQFIRALDLTNARLHFTGALKPQQGLGRLKIIGRIAVQTLRDLPRALTLAFLPKNGVRVFRRLKYRTIKLIRSHD
jgi:hypothetical protein